MTKEHRRAAGVSRDDNVKALAEAVVAGGEELPALLQERVDRVRASGADAEAVVLTDGFALLVQPKGEDAGVAVMCYRAGRAYDDHDDCDEAHFIGTTLDVVRGWINEWRPS